MFIINLNAQKSNLSEEIRVEPDWVESFASNNFIPSDIETDSSGNIYTSGTFNRILINKKNEQLSRITNNSSSNQANSYFLIKHNHKGELLWIRTASGKSRTYEIELDAYGNIYTIGEVFSKEITFNSLDSLFVSLDKPNTISSRGIFICKYSPKGKIIATKFFSQDNREVPKDFLKLIRRIIYTLEETFFTKKVVNQKEITF